MFKWSLLAAVAIVAVLGLFNQSSATDFRNNDAQITAHHWGGGGHNGGGWRGGRGSGGGCWR